MTEDTIITFYTEHTDDPATWASPKPAFDDVKFNRELERRAGLVGSVPRFRLRWAGSLDEYQIEEYDELTGYVYIEDGQEKFVPCTDLDFEFPDGCAIAPRLEVTKIFMPRWVIEEYQLEHGFYQKAWCIEALRVKSSQAGRVEMLSHYREPSEVDLEMAEGVARQRETLSVSDIIAGLEKEHRLGVKHKKDAKNEIVEEMRDEARRIDRDGIKSRVYSVPKLPEIERAKV